MASSAPLGLSRPFRVYRPGLRLAAKAHRVPNLNCLSFFPCRLPCPSGPTVGDCSISVGSSLRLVSNMARHTAWPTQKSVHAWSIFRAAKFALCYGPESCLPGTDTGFYVRAFIPSSHLVGTSNITTRVSSQFPRPDSHRLDKQPYGLHGHHTNYHPTSIAVYGISMVSPN